MQKSILLYLSKLEGFKTAIKNCHWAAKSMNAHEFMDSLEDIVSDHQDLVAEIVQGAYNTKIKVNDFKPRPYRISTFTKLVSDIYNAADKFYATIQGNKRFIGLRSVMEDFMGKMQQQAYLNAMCTEGTMKVLNLLKENAQNNKIKLTEENFFKLLSETAVGMLKEISFNTAKDAYYKSYDRALKGGETDRQEKQRHNLYKHMDRRKGEAIDPDMPVRIVGGNKEGEYTVEDILNNFDIKGYVEPFENSRYKDSKIVGYPRIAGYLGPMWDGDAIRYESQDVYDTLSI